ncbi:MAG: Crp/Fnr family transcriptional regulator [Bacteroidia bacterium]
MHTWRETYYNTISSMVEMPKEEFEKFYALHTFNSYRKGETVVSEGEVATHVAFVISGAICSYYLDQNGEKHIVQIATRGNWISDAQSFLTGNPSSFFVEIVQDCEVLMLSRKDFELVGNDLRNVDRLFRIMMQRAYAEALQRIAGIFSTSAEEPYKNLTDSKPYILQQVPLSYIASFLGIKAQSLSRIRKQISGKK